MRICEQALLIGIGEEPENREGDHDRRGDCGDDLSGPRPPGLALLTRRNEVLLAEYDIGKQAPQEEAAGAALGGAEGRQVDAEPGRNILREGIDGRPAPQRGGEIEAAQTQRRIKTRR